VGFGFGVQSFWLRVRVGFGGYGLTKKMMKKEEKRTLYMENTLVEGSGFSVQCL
jgi:hypothetical protein